MRRNIVVRKPAASRAPLVTTFTLPPKLARELQELADYMQPVTVEWLVQDSLEALIESLWSDSSTRGDTRDNFMIDRKNGTATKVKAQRGGVAR